eukprot:TRINITY_DN21174_c0_g1_i1.p1 TRINITY_DN21174_c0_g1~~TRINITY_DN21174_c0_g1_i1.p1  ORF type:complete len:172 (+),score=17.25 TRINITY_DN21174_c0_g1_i1:67-516(+)
MGQCQFMPSSYEAYAVDFDGDGFADIWTSPGDSLASIANFLVRHGWKRGLPMGQRVSLGASSLLRPSDLLEKKSVSEWCQKHQVEAVLGKILLGEDAEANLVAPNGASKEPYFLASDNFRVVLRYNNSDLFAMAIAELALQISSRDSTR